MCSIRSPLACLWSCLLFYATRATCFACSTRFVLMPLLPPLAAPSPILHVLHVLQIPRDRLWTWIQEEGESTESSEDEEDQSSDEDGEEDAEE